MNLDRFTPLFKARSVALVGASSNPKKWGYSMLRNMVNGGFQGNIYPVNQEADTLRGLKVYRSISDLPEVPDLAGIVVPPPSVVLVIKECIARGVKAGVVITAGFAELGDHGRRLQDEMVKVAREGGMVLVGPNCNGIVSPWNKLYVTFPFFQVPPGPIAIVAQSGNVLDGLTRQIMLKGLGCSVGVASGNEADLHIEDYLEYMAEDENTRVILCYIEGLQDARRFFQVAQRASRKKPIIVLKAGKTRTGMKAAASHTAAIASSDVIFDAACKQAGLVRAGSMDEMLNIGIAFLRQPLPRGRRLAIVTGGGGVGVLAADACEEEGFDIVKLPDKVISELDKVLPSWWNRGNPVDLVGGSYAEQIFRTVEIVLASDAIDSMVYLTLRPALKLENVPSNAAEAATEEWCEYQVKVITEAVEHFNSLAAKYKKPVLLVSEHVLATAEQEVKIIQSLGQHNTMCYRQPHHAAIILSALTKYGEWLRKTQPR